MKACILSVGTEILMGQILNTNTKYLSERLNEYGISVLHHVSVGDNPNRLKDILELYLDKVDMIVTTGGLGPTQDDITKEIVAEVMQTELKLDEQIYSEIKSYFEKSGREMTPNNKKQAFIPENSIALKNDYGTAPGIYINKNSKHVFLLPGPPREMKPMFENQMVTILKTFNEKFIVSKHLRVFGIGESAVEDKLIPLIDKQSNPTIATYAKTGNVEIRVTATGESKNQADDILKPTVKQIQNILGDKIYSLDGEDLHSVVAKELIDRDITLSIAESCTGGLLSTRLTEVSGVSSVFKFGVVTYSNESKVNVLGVSEQTLNEYGAVSEQVATQMLEGLQNIVNTDIYLSITGIAGPSGFTDKKPVGLVYIAIKYKGDVDIYKFNFNGDREKIREYSVLNSLNIIRQKII